MIDNLMKEFEENGTKYSSHSPSTILMLMLIDRIDTLNRKLDMLNKIQSRKQ